MKHSKILMALLGGMALFAGSVYAADRTATKSGNWEDDSTWKNAEKPGTEDNLRFENNAEVTLSSAVTIASEGGGSDTGTLNIVGADASLTVTGNWKFFYSPKFNVNVKDGATFDIGGNLSWGTGDAADHITVTNGSTLKVGHFDQFNGSKKANGGGSIDVDKSTFSIYKTGGVTMGSGSADYSMVINLKNGSSFTNNGKDFHLGASGNNSESIVNVFSSSISSVNTLDIMFKEGATNKMVIAGQNASVYAGNNVIISSQSATGTGVAKIQFGGFDENGSFVAPTANALSNNYEFKIYDGGSMDFLLGAENFSTEKDKSMAIVNARYFKSVKGVINIDFNNVVGLDQGTYWATIISSTERIDTNSDKKLDGHPFDWDNDIKVIESDIVKYLGWSVDNDNKVLYIQVEVIPEPSTYAAILGALALGFVVYRRRK